jgi:hypothetical protein
MIHGVIVIRQVVSAIFLAACFPAYASNPCLSDSFQPKLQPPPSSNFLDVQRLHVMKGLRTELAVQEIQEEADDPTPKFWAAAGVSPDSNPKLARTISIIQPLAASIVLDLKAQFARMRANEVDPSLTTVVPVPWHKAYPSGHATQSFLTAYAFAQSYPEKEAVFMRLASKVAINREIAGLHYSTDTDAGAVLALQIWKAITPECKAK